MGWVRSSTFSRTIRAIVVYLDIWRPLEESDVRGTIQLLLALIALHVQPTSSSSEEVQTMPSDRKSTSDGDSFPLLVLVPGLKGSTLFDAQGQQRWLTWRQALGLSYPELSLPLLWEDGVQQRDELVPIAPIRKVITEDIYGSFLDWALTSGRSVHPFAYDWRRDTLENTDRFVEFLEL